MLLVVNLPANAGDARDVGLIAASEGSPGGVYGVFLPGEAHGLHSSILAWRSPWTEEPGRL